MDKKQRQFTFFILIVPFGLLVLLYGTLMALQFVPHPADNQANVQKAEDAKP